MDTLTPIVTGPRISGPRIGAVERYAVAVLSTLAGVILHILLHRRFGSSIDSILLVVVAFSTWYGGFGAGLVTLALVGLGTILTTVPPVGSLHVGSHADALALIVYGILGLLMSALIASLLGARRRAERAAERTSRLHALSLALAPASTAVEASAITIRHAMEALHASAGAIVYGAPGAPRQPAVRSPGHPGDPDDPRGPLADVIGSGYPVFLGSAAAWLKHYPAAAARGLTHGAVVAVPFVSDGRTVGGLELEFDHDRRMGLERRAARARRSPGKRRDTPSGLPKTTPKGRAAFFGE